jgi:hypothetical protein
LDESGQPLVSETFPMHVYFPTDELPGLRVAVHAEWVLTIDRRLIATTPEALPGRRLLDCELTTGVTHLFPQEKATRNVCRRYQPDSGRPPSRPSIAGSGFVPGAQGDPHLGRALTTSRQEGNPRRCGTQTPS